MAPTSRRRSRGTSGRYRRGSRVVTGAPRPEDRPLDRETMSTALARLSGAHPRVNSGYTSARSKRRSPIQSNSGRSSSAQPRASEPRAASTRSKRASGLRRRARAAAPWPPPAARGDRPDATRDVWQLRAPGRTARRGTCWCARRAGRGRRPLVAVSERKVACIRAHLDRLDGP